MLVSFDIFFPNESLRYNWNRWRFFSIENNEICIISRCYENISESKCQAYFDLFRLIFKDIEPIAQSCNDFGLSLSRKLIPLDK